MPRRPSLSARVAELGEMIARMAGMIERQAFALEATLEAVPTERPTWADPAQTFPLSPHDGYRASVERITAEARALVAEHRQRAGTRAPKKGEG